MEAVRESRRRAAPVTLVRLGLRERQRGWRRSSHIQQREPFAIGGRRPPRSRRLQQFLPQASHLLRRALRVSASPALPGASRVCFGPRWNGSWRLLHPSGPVWRRWRPVHAQSHLAPADSLSPHHPPARTPCLVLPRRVQGAPRTRDSVDARLHALPHISAPLLLACLLLALRRSGRWLRRSDRLAHRRRTGRQRKAPQLLAPPLRHLLRVGPPIQLQRPTRPARHPSARVKREAAGGVRGVRGGVWAVGWDVVWDVGCGMWGVGWGMEGIGGEKNMHATAPRRLTAWDACGTLQSTAGGLCGGRKSAVEGKHAHVCAPRRRGGWRRCGARDQRARRETSCAESSGARERGRWRRSGCDFSSR